MTKEILQSYRSKKDEIVELDWVLRHRWQDEGLIAIRICQERNDIIIEVKDNGVGMDRKTAASILDRNAEHIHDKEGNGIGIINIDERLKLTYGEGYGVTIESELEAGTSVTIRLPRLDNIEPVLTSR